MNIKSSRALEGMKPVLKDSESSGPDPVYEVWEAPENSEGWVNNTRLKSGRFGTEYPKTFGHYHPTDAPLETYKVIQGEGVFVLQKRKMEAGILNMEEVEEVLLVKIKEGDEVTISKEWGHSMSNTGSLELQTYDNWSHGHTPEDYRIMEKLQGMAYYLVEEDGPTPVKNPSYKNLPEPVWLTAEEFKNR
jgi:oxalate decarboxylase/phosphoglucose isomerase-like protein (cupin superfamily)